MDSTLPVNRRRIIETKSLPKHYATTYVSGHGHLHQGDINHINITNYNSNVVASQDNAETRLHLKADYFAAVDSFRRAQIKQARADTCDWIWATSFKDWLADERAKFFWLSGKPGSGKSTLMKYLATPKNLMSILPEVENKWAVISFFFDFRRGEHVENSLEGFITTLLKQLQDRNEEGTIYEHRRIDARDLLEIKLKHSSEYVLVFVDGLDEFEGRMSNLTELILSFEQYDKVKVCVASRREPNINFAFRQLPNLHISDYNADGIQSYIDFTIDHFREDQDLLDSLNLPKVQTLLHERAEGVFLWVYLALQEVKEACAMGATAQEVESLLINLPSELKPFYQRIVDKLPSSRRCEAAVLYIILEDADLYPVSIELLFAAVQFLVYEVGIVDLPKGLNNIQQFVRRFSATMGGLFELCAPVGPCAAGDMSLRPKVIHETVRAYSRETRWAQDSLPVQFQRTVPNRLWARLCYWALIASDKRLSGEEAHVPNSWFNDVCIARRSNTQSVGCIETQDFARILRTNLNDDNMVRWSRLLYHSLDAVYAYLEEMEEVDIGYLRSSADAAMQSRWIRLPLVLWPKDQQSQIPISAAIADFRAPQILLAAAHNAYRYLQAQDHYISTLTDAERESIALATVLTSKLVRDALAGNSTAGRRAAVDGILVHNTEISSFLVAIYLYLGYGPIPKFLSKHLDQQFVKRWPPPSVPLFAGLNRVYPAEPPLFMWACETTTPIERGKGSHSDQLEVLLRLGIDINDVSSTGSNVVHYLISEHIIRHTFLEDILTCDPDDDIAPGIEKLYLVEKAGADFSFKFRGKTVLQALHDGYQNLSETPEPKEDHLLYDLNTIAETRFSQLFFMLRHKEETGHLPQPMMGTNYRGATKLPILKDNIEHEHCSTCMEGRDKPRSSAEALKRASLLDAGPRSWI